MENYIVRVIKAVMVEEVMAAWAATEKDVHQELTIR